MAQVLHGRARTTTETRREIQNSKESIAKLAKRFNLDPKTVAKWRKRDYVHDTPMGPKKPHSTVLKPEEEAAIAVFRSQTLLPLDDCLYTLQDTMPRLTRSNLYRSLKRSGLDRLPQGKPKKREIKKFKTYDPGYVHIDIAEVRTEKGKIYLFVGIDRTTKYTYAALYDQETRANAVAFLANLIKAFPYPLQTILTDNGVQFANRKTDIYAFPHPFGKLCTENKIEHRLTQVKHPWTNGQVERMNRTIKEATVYKYYYDTPQTLEEHLSTFLNAYNLGRRLKALKGKTPLETALEYCRNSLNLNEEEIYHYTLAPYT